MSYQLLDLNTVTARKDHQCIWCGEQILTNTPYVRETCRDDRELKCRKWHPECWNFSAEHFKAEDCFDPHEMYRPIDKNPATKERDCHE